MDQIVNLSSGKTFDISKEFPQIDAGDKIAIMFTGGVESYLVAHIAKHLYGIDNIVFVIILADQYSNFSSNPDKMEKVKKDFYGGVEKIGGLHTHEIHESAFSGHDFVYNLILKDVKEKFPSIKHILSGYNNIHRESMVMLMDCDWDKGKFTIDDANEFFNSHKDSYPELKRFMEEMKGNLYFLNGVVGFEQAIYYFYKVIKPLDKFTNIEVVEIYKNLSILNRLFDTTSCNRSTSVQNCGICKSCLVRKDAIEKNNIVDLTVYG